MEYQVLGPVEVLRDGISLALGGPKQRALLAMLILNANHVVSSDRLADDLWGDDAPSDPAAVLAVYVSNLRKILEPGRLTSAAPQVLLTRAPGYVLSVDPRHVDALRFMTLAADARQAIAGHALVEGVATMREALGLWRGTPLIDVAHHRFAGSHVARLEEARLAALEDLYDAELELSRHSEAVGEISALVAEHPLRERLRGQLMLALYRCGRQAEALSAFQEGRRRLVEELGLDPSPALQELEQAILGQRVAPALPTGAGPQRRAPPALPAALQVPRQLRFLGRAAETQVLTGAWKRAAVGGSEVVLVAGEAGIGKTRLVSEVARIAHDEGATVLYGRCDPELGVPYQPFIEALGYYVATWTDEDVRAQAPQLGREVGRVVPGLAGLLQHLPAHPSADAETERYRLFQAVVTILAKASLANPVVVVLEDLHWATKPTVLLFRHLIASAHPMSLLVLATYRDSDVSAAHPLTDVLADLRREEGVQRLPLKGFSSAEVETLVEHTAGHKLDENGSALARALWNDTDGSPFFLTEILRHLSESGTIRQHAGRSVYPSDLASISLPESVRDVVLRRVRHLSSGASRAVAVAAVVGSEFDLGLLSRVTGTDEDGLLDSLEEAVTAAVLTEAGTTPGHFRFSHALIRHSLYEQLGPTRRARLHRQVAECLEDTPGAGTSADLGMLAHHWLHAGAFGDDAKAVAYCRRAGDKALAELAYEEAAAHFERALLCLPPGDREQDRLHCDVLLALGGAQSRAGDGRYRATMAEASGIARALHDGERLALAALV